MQNLESDSLFQVQAVSAKTRTAAGLRLIYYRGPSMSPTFRPGHVLYVRPSTRDVASGDVIVYADSSQRMYIAHRVISITDRGFATRGDNNARCDLTPVAHGQLIGRVEIVEDSGRLKPVIGGWRGLVFARVNWNIRQACAWFRRTFGGPYRWLRHSGFVSRLWHPTITQLRINTDHGLLIKYICRRRVVARWWQQQNRFECDKPYDLVIPRPDEK